MQRGCKTPIGVDVARLSLSEAGMGLQQAKVQTADHCFSGLRLLDSQWGLEGGGGGGGQK